MNKDEFMTLVKELRARTGIGIGKCKEALEQASGNLEEAIANLRKAGLASAVKKEGRTANEGRIALGESDDAVALVEVGAETDFVVKNELFQKFAATVAKQVATTKPADVTTLLTQPALEDASLTVDQQRATTVQTLGENIQIKRLVIWKKSDHSSISAYSHMGGQIVAMVEIEGEGDHSALARDIAMHIAAESPEYLKADEIPQSTLENEKKIIREQIKGKPESIMDKIMEGKIKSYIEEVCLLSQNYVKDSSMTVQQLVEKSGPSLKVKRFIRWSAGKE